MTEKYYYEYQGQMLSLAQLEQISGVRKETIRTRINNGWTVEAAVQNTSPGNDLAHIPPDMEGKSLYVRFPRHIDSVISRMQPSISKTYIATPHLGGTKRNSATLFYIIRLDNSKPLIVYPGEFEIVSAVTDSTG